MRISLPIVLLSFLLLIPLYGCVRRAGRKPPPNQTQPQYIDKRITEPESNYRSNVVKMETENGINYIYIEINGLRLRFVFDTGASVISISQAEASVLYRQGTLRQEDIIGVTQFKDATGRISSGTAINLRTVKIGNRVLNNIEALVVESSDSPLLLGQSALERFGRISINNQRGEITFE